MIRCRYNWVLLYIHSVLLDFIITGYPGRVYLFFVFLNPSRRIKQPCKSVTIVFFRILATHRSLSFVHRVHRYVASVVGQNSVTDSITRCVPQQLKLRLQLIQETAGAETSHSV